MHKLKGIIRLLIPPIFILGYRKLIQKGGGKCFIGEYADFDELRSQLKIEPNYYWPGAIEQEFNVQTKQILEWNSENPPSGMYRTNFLPTALALFPEKSIRILDIGGGVGITFEHLKFSLRKRGIHVTVFDQPPSVQNGKKLYAHNPDIEFVESLPETKDCFDVVYFGSSIQYFPDYRALLSKIAKLNPKLIIIADSSFNVSKTFACAQVNMPKTTIPYMVINKVELEEVAHNLGYQLICQSTNAESPAIFDSDEYPLHRCKSWNFIFQKSTTLHLK